MIQNRDHDFYFARHDDRPRAGDFRTSGPSGRIESIAGRRVAPVHEAPVRAAGTSQPEPAFRQGAEGIWQQQGVPVTERTWLVELHEDCRVLGQDFRDGDRIRVDAKRGLAISFERIPHRVIL